MPKIQMTCVLIERRNLSANICVERIPHKQKGRYCGCASTNQGTPKIAGKPAEARQKLGQTLPHNPQKEPMLLTP